MRKITRESVSAFLNCKRFSSGNMSVEVDSMPTSSRLYLHGNLIAAYYPGQDQVRIYDAGWQTNTTKDRLNGVLSLITILGMPAPCIYQKDHVWYLSTNGGDVEWTGGAVFQYTSGLFSHVIPECALAPQ